MSHVPTPTVASVPTTFQVGRHAVVIELRQQRWTVSVDGVASPTTFSTQAEAWEAGVREADRLDRTAR